jgi:hypothetical protein
LSQLDLLSILILMGQAMLMVQEDMAKRKGCEWKPPIGSTGTEQELYRKAGRYHSRLQNVEYECWVFQGALPPDEKLSEMGLNKADSYFWQTGFDPETLDVC